MPYPTVQKQPCQKGSSIEEILEGLRPSKKSDSPSPYQGGRLINNLPESQVIKMWQQLLLNTTELTTEGGEPIRIIYPGRSNDDQGADFRDAIIATKGGLIKGDIEVHVKSSDWRAHRHHQNPVYNWVILHVVMWHNTKAATTLQDGRSIPTLALHRYLTDTTSQWLNPVYPPAALNTPCFEAAHSLNTGMIAEFLERAGEERFLAKANRFQADIAQTGPSQSLYQGIMGALGYAKNKLPFLELARRLPLQVLEYMTQGKMSDEECLARQQALLLGTAGLLPSQRSNWHQENKSDDKWIDKLEKLWVSCHHTESMPDSAWHLFKVRPNNFPVRRIVAMSYLILRYQEKGIVEAVVNMIKEAPLTKGHYQLVDGLLVTTEGYWANHFDFSLDSRLKARSLLGRRRAADIAVNVLLPFTFAWGKLASQPELEQKSSALYHSFPKLVDNTVERHMSNQLGLDSSLVNSAQRQQGLIHIYNTLCSQGKCYCCPLGQLKAGHHIQI